ncbi:MAG: winged helix-turn-helix transcriptional regulator [Rhodothermales bacterium]|nr:winged helix-turn-helix transcriptional regulator [Rhodothermales bacterium]MBO6780856.1 winged helix-turn-helix transcriptional regulator [Rhodothermales bacterium]
MLTTIEDRRDRVFHALADRTRRDILRRSLTEEHSITELAGAYDMSFAAVQKHVSVLHGAGLLKKRRAGRRAMTSGDVEGIRSAAVLLRELEDLWRGRIARMEQLLEADAVDQNSLSPHPLKSLK